ncbi:MAG: TetR/AcrR family transcriptional regulator C-terminal domain-containing protein [Solobacterium sp.]|nr:TetR/AcrR family transcriptional regulator C-terminal domain-containing protein [Solobacterium sp.]MBR3128271.1 TetR/AcrR family transcriptional regulator C-terminal domain-containing protein [Solobacterium sp.]
MAVSRISTRQLLAHSLEDLIASHHPFEKILVSDITDNCGLSRKSFYNYFKDKFEVVTWIYSNDMAEPIRKAAGEITWAEATRLSFERIYSKKDFYSSVLKYNNQNSLREFVVPNIVDECINVIRHSGNSDQIDENLIFSLNFYFAGVVYSAVQWIENECRISPDLFSHQLILSMPDNVAKALNL